MAVVLGAILRLPPVKRSLAAGPARIALAREADRAQRLVTQAPGSAPQPPSPAARRSAVGPQPALGASPNPGG